MFHIVLPTPSQAQSRTFAGLLIRSFLTLFTTVVITVPILHPAVTARAQDSTWVQQENSLDGTDDWYVAPSGLAADHELAGYATTSSVIAGQDLVLRIDNSVSATQRARAYRLGWYGGAGGRLVAQTDWEPAEDQPDATFVGTDDLGGTINMVDASHWSDSLSFDTQAWPEGMYLVVLEAENGMKSQVPVMVRSTTFTGRTALVTSPTTWQAYNRYGGYSAYWGQATGDVPAGGGARSRVVSLDRPLDAQNGVFHFLAYERSLIVEAERTGVNLAYTSNVDLARGGLEAHRGAAALIVLGHDEYWSNSHVAVVRGLRDSGTNVVVAGGNTLWWRIRYSADHRRYAIYKNADEDPVKDPAQATLNFPDSTTLGLLGSRYICHSVNAPMTITDPGFFLFRGIGVEAGDQFDGLLREEVDAGYDSWSSPATLSVAAHSPFLCKGTTPLHADLTYYTVSSGAGVVNLSSMGFAIALDERNRARWPMPETTVEFARSVYSTAVLEAAAGGLGLRHQPSRNAAQVLTDTVGGPFVDTATTGSGAFADLDGDTIADLMATTSTGDLYYYRTIPGDRPRLRSGVKVGQGWQSMNWMALVPDIDGDGHTELVARRDDGTLWLYRGSGEGRWSVPARVGTGWQHQATLTVTPDISGDGKPELLARATDGRLLRYSFTSLAATLSDVRVVGSSWGAMTTLVAVSDISGDDYPDVMAVRSDGLLFAYTTKGGRLSLIGQVGRGWGGFTHIASPGDMSGDGRFDLLGIRSDGNLYFYANLGTRWGVATQIGSRWGGIRLLT